jgi:hypothetical protein
MKLGANQRHPIGWDDLRRGLTGDGRRWQLRLRRTGVDPIFCGNVELSGRRLDGQKGGRAPFQSRGSTKE